MNTNLILMTDSYKLTHAPQYPKGTTEVHSYMESRGGQFAETVFFGLQYYVDLYLKGPVVTQDDIEEAADFCERHFGNPDLFNRAGWQYILDTYQGWLPVDIQSVDEGSVIPTDNVLLTIRNTDPKCFWLPNFLETLLLKLWYPITVATLSREIKKTILRYLEKTGDPSTIDFKLHDFGYRGVSSEESAAIGGAAHLVNFKGSDTVAGILLLQDFYFAEMAGYSVPAAEHSTITSWGREGEAEAYENMLDTYPTGVVSVVSDSYNIFNACEHLWGGVLKQKVENRKGTLVVRPDSGEPKLIVAECLQMLGQKFGTTINEKGYKVLPPCIRVMQGDGINLTSIGAILEHITRLGYSADNLVFGMGGALLQMVNRDTQKFAFKASSIVVNGERRDVQKDPITDAGKKSKTGVLALRRTRLGAIETVDRASLDRSDTDLLTCRLHSGWCWTYESLDNIRERAAL